MKTLVVDDELVSRKKMIKILSDFSQCDSVKDGKAAVRVFKAAIETGKPYDLVTLDVFMPDIDGTRILSMLRKIENELHLDVKARILMVTSHSDSDTVKACLGKCNGYVVKPFNREVLVYKLTKLNLL
jgi:two-component system chemotaxis response regulator CheY